MKFSTVSVVTLAVLGVASCATSLTSLSDPHALKAGQLEVTVAGQGSASSVLLDKSWQGLSAIPELTGTSPGADTSRTLERDLVDSALAWSLFWPTVDPELLLRCGVPSGPLPGLDLGLRLSPSLVKVDGKAQVFESRDARHALALQLGYAWHFGGPHKDIEWLTLVEFGRHDLDLMLSWGFGRPDLIEGYLGPRLMLSWLTVKRRLGADLVDALPQEMRQFNPAQLFEDSMITQAGSTVGIKLGYRWLFVRLELSALYMWFRPVVLGQQRTFDGLVLAPSAALSATW